MLESKHVWESWVGVQSAAVIIQVFLKLSNSVLPREREMKFSSNSCWVDRMRYPVMWPAGGFPFRSSNQLLFPPTFKPLRVTLCPHLPETIPVYSHHPCITVNSNYVSRFRQQIICSYYFYLFLNTLINPNFKNVNLLGIGDVFHFLVFHKDWGNWVCPIKNPEAALRIGWHSQTYDEAGWEPLLPRSNGSVLIIGVTEWP